MGQSTFCRPGDPTEWFFNAVNQIRALSWSAEREPGQYALTLALCLIRKGCNPHPELKEKEPNTLRAIAFFFGQKICEQWRRLRRRHLARTSVDPGVLGNDHKFHHQSQSCLTRRRQRVSEATRGRSHCGSPSPALADHVMSLRVRF